MNITFFKELVRVLQGQVFHRIQLVKDTGSSSKPWACARKSASAAMVHRRISAAPAAPTPTVLGSAHIREDR